MKSSIASDNLFVKLSLDLNYSLIFTLIMNIKWKIYFWFIFIFSAITIYNYLTAFLTTFRFADLLTISPFKFADLVTIINLTIIIFGLYTYTYNKYIFLKTFWSIFFIMETLLIILNLGQIILNLDTLTKYVGPSLYFSILLTTGIIFLPTYYAIYQLGFGKRK